MTKCMDGDLIHDDFGLTVAELEMPALNWKTKSLRRRPVLGSHMIYRPGKNSWIQSALQTRTRDVCGNPEGKRWSFFLHLALMDGDLRSQ